MNGFSGKGKKSGRVESNPGYLHEKRGKNRMREERKESPPRDDSTSTRIIARFSTTSSQ